MISRCGDRSSHEDHGSGEYAAELGSFLANTVNYSNLSVTGYVERLVKAIAEE